MCGQSISFNFVRPMNTIPHFFDENDVAELFTICHNLKHLAMLQTLFYGYLRASELCSLDDCVLDLKSLMLRIEGKGGKESIVYITDECAKTLRRYLEIRAPLEIDGRSSTRTLVDVGNVVASIACSCTIRSLQVSRSMGAFMYFHGIVWAAYS